ncbi:MAG: hypothetical protein ACOYKJ_08905 [Candidatus Howiella sp.]|jgi:hypothetical protein
MICFRGYNESMTTFKAADGLTVGMPVIVTANATVGKGTAGAAICGVARSVREGIASIQTNGYVELPYTGTAPTLGVGSLVCDGDGGVKTGTGRSVVIVEVDTTNSTVGFIL